MAEADPNVGGYFLTDIKFALRFISKKWTIDILMVLVGDSLKFSEFERYLKGISSKILNDRLSVLQEYNLIDKHIEEVTPLKIQYTLTPKGLNILKTLSSLSKVGSDLRKPS